MQFISDEHKIAQRVAPVVSPGDVVNLGVGLPLFALQYIEDVAVVHTEGGAIGVHSKYAAESTVDAGGNKIGLKPGGCFFDSAMSFAIIRKGLIDVSVIGAVEVDLLGNVCSFSTQDRIFGYGGAADLMRHSRKTVIAMRHADKSGRCKFRRRCTEKITANLYRKGFWVATDKGLYRFADGEYQTIEGDQICI